MAARLRVNTQKMCTMHATWILPVLWLSTGVASGLVTRTGHGDGAIGYIVYNRDRWSDTSAGDGSDQGNVERRRRTVRTVTDPNSDKLHVVTDVSSRFVQTHVKSTFTNTGSNNQEVAFVVQLPDSAFISNFTMTIGDELYVAEVKKKADADREYQDARKQNKTAGLVHAKKPLPNRNMQVFGVTINVRAKSSTHVVLTYQQLLQRRLGLFELVTNVKPMQPVGDISVTVHLHEPQGIQRLYVVEPGQEVTNSVNAVNTVIKDISDEEKIVTYSPTPDARRRLTTLTNDAVIFVIRYDVKHERTAGFLQLDDDYFVHYFSPQGLSPLGKNIVFVFDISGSMAGRKIAQVRDAMTTILDQLHTNDKFLLLFFETDIQVWPSNGMPVIANEENVGLAKTFARKNLVPMELTGINAALLKAVSLIQQSEQGASSMILFLTDGHPTSGETVAERIVRNVVKSAGGRVSIFSLGFGQNLDFAMLQILSQRTGGFARRIYEGVDANIQLSGLFLEIGTPLLYDVVLSYDDSVVDSNSLTRVAFPQYFNGSELIVAGKLLSNYQRTFTVTVNGMSDAPVTLTNHISSSANVKGFMDKLYVYMKIKDLLRQKLLTDDTAKQMELDQYVVRLALEYNLVTPLTSMIIVQHDSNPNSNDEMIKNDYPCYTFDSQATSVGVILHHSKPDLHICACFLATIILSRHVFLP